MADSKPVEFRGSSLEDLRAFPLTARREAGHQLDQVQNGREPDDWKPMTTVGRGVKEIRIRDEAGAFRVLYVARFAGAIEPGYSTNNRLRRAIGPHLLRCARSPSSTYRPVRLRAAPFARLVSATLSSRLAAIVVKHPGCVLHCFQKKTQKTSKADAELAAKRYRELLKELGQ